MTNVIAHRGASAAAAENTIESFRLAVELGADGVELDVRRTRDGRAVVHHDPTLPDGRAIVDLDAVDIPGHVPDLAAALEACPGVMVNVEIKNVRSDDDFDPDQVMAGVVVDTVSSAGRSDDVVVSSFGFAAIDRVRELAPAVRTAWLVTDRGEAPPLIERAAAAGHRGIHPRWPMVDEAFVDHARAAGLFVNVWTVNDPETIRRLADLGVDGIVTDVPDIAREVLDGR